MADASDFVGVILAGGKGTRMVPFSDRYPKPLLPVCNRPLIVHQITMMKDLGISDIFVLIGHKGFMLSMALGDGSQFGVRLKYVEQTEILGIAHALGRMESYVTKPFLMFLGDIFFVPRDLNEMLVLFRQQGEGAILAVKDEPDPLAIRKNYSVSIGASGLVERVIEKPRHTTNRLKGVGLYLFGLSVFDAIRRTPRTAMRDEYEITDTIQVMIDHGLPVRAANSIAQDVNITSPIDLLECNLIAAESVPRHQLIGKNTEIHPKANIERCVIGSNVRICNPITLRETLVFDTTLIDASSGFDRFVLTPEVVVNCRYDHDGVRPN